ncbi:type I restriction-modification system subunit M [Geomonas nitrogeniifigens]|uniref:class I SAM-dependent DNA methyltransferase n=1 Tax=Geomonas diazotrophica TaxID=2843197 RepID=UPI001C2C2E0A|nr:N-6 DNA methylase [Geomonas nitrogeniifigens]QXE88117.1 type I restriction-modification system subunit M [Geomonas nitrogeniifigens]
MAVNFINSDLQQQVDRLMNELFAGGVNNPMTSVEQISYLMFLKSLTEKDEEQEQLQKLMGGKHTPLFSGGWSQYSWRTVARLSGDPLYNTLSEAFEKFHELPNLSPIGKVLFKQAHLKIYNRPTLRSVVTIIDEMDYNNTQKYDTDVKGDLYEYLLSKIAVSGTNGQFRTPRHIIQMMVKLLDPKPGQYILDPACGTAGFLVEAYKHIVEQHTSSDLKQQGHHHVGDNLRPDQHEFLKNHALTGYDNDSDMIKVAIMNLYLHGLENANVRHHDPITLPNPNEKKYDIILANPPFAGKVNKEAILEDFDLKTASTELLFGEYFYKHLLPGGKAAVIVPEGVLFGSTTAHKKLRGWLLDNTTIHAVISLPPGVFKPYAGVKTSILIFERGGKSDKVWFYEVSGDGLSLDDKRTPQPDKNDIPDLIAKWGTKPVGGNSWYATREEIKGNDENLTASRYKPQVHEATNHTSPKEIIAEVLELEGKITSGLNALLAKIGG